MEIALQLAKSIGGLFIIMLVGVVFVKTKILSTEDSKAVSKIILYMAMPTSIIRSFQVECTPEKLTDFAIALAAAMLCQAVFMLIGWGMKKTGFNTVEITSVEYPTVANLTIPLVTATLGEEWVIFTAAYTALQNIFCWTHQRTVLSGEKASLKKIFLNVNILAIAVGLVMFIFGIKLPVFLGDVFSMTAATLGPLSMFLVGMTVAAANLKEIFSNKRLYGVLILRMIVCPMVMATIFVLTGMAHLTEQAHTVLIVLMMSAAGPISAMTTQFAQLYDNMPEYAGSLNVASTIVCIVTMPLMIAYYQLLLML